MAATLAGVAPVSLTDFHRAVHAHAITPYGLTVADNCVSSALRAQHSSSVLSQATLEGLDRIAHPTTHPAESVILVEGQTPRGVFVLCQGRVKLMSTNRDGKTFIMKIAQPGEILGLHAVVTGGTQELTVETLQPCQLAFISRADFLLFIKQHGDACLHIAEQLSSDCHSAYEVIRSIGLSQSVKEKLARLLLHWSEDGHMNEGTMRLTLALTHEEVAQLIGTSRETVTRILGELKRQRVVELKGATLLIKNMAALERLAQA
ncbi:MAG: Crp/Fnr family transcriptional regulator [Acidobacteria bacterium]|nr:Crp/Fnr family transcriptional regulator [Acidobacteriota bacterium]